MKSKLFLTIVLIALLGSCSYNYRYIYNSYVENSNIKNSQDTLKNNFQDSVFLDPLTFKDSILKFTFYPQPNGIFFEIQNLSDNNIFLLWDESYFIDPNNNSSKALNTDILNTQLKVIEKQNNESIIPKRGTFRRFTTSSKNIVSIEKIDFTTYYLSPNLTLQNNYYNEIYLHNPYWITSSKINYADKNDAEIKHNMEMDRMKNINETNNNLGLGFTFRVGDKQIDYDFKIKIDKILVYRLNSATYIYDSVDTINIIH